MFYEGKKTIIAKDKIVYLREKKILNGDPK